jgi:hypothetical protein
LFQVPEWLHLAHSAGGINGDRAVLLSELTGIFLCFSCQNGFTWRHIPLAGINGDRAFLLSELTGIFSVF